MAATDLIELPGIVEEVFPGGTFAIRTESGTRVVAHLGGKLRKFKIRVVMGDKVDVQVSPYDLTKGRISYRHK